MNRSRLAVVCVVFFTAIASLAAPITLSENGSSPSIGAGSHTVATIWHEADGLHAAVIGLDRTIVARALLPQSTAAQEGRIAFDGQRYLAVWIDGTGDAAALRSVLIGEDGQLGSVTTIAADALASAAPVVVWDGTQYVVFWSVKDKNARYADVNAQGMAGAPGELAGVPAVGNATAQAGQVALVWETYSTERSKAAINFAVLNSDGTLSQPKVIASFFWIEGVYGRALRDETIAIIYPQYYTSWINKRYASLTGLVGTRMSPDGTPQDVFGGNDPNMQFKMIHHEFSEAISTDTRLFTIDNKFVVAWRYANRELTSTIDQNGNVGPETLIFTGYPLDMMQSSDIVWTAARSFAIVYDLGMSHRVELQFTRAAKRRAVR